jgi:hypothetical protein
MWGPAMGHGIPEPSEKTDHGQCFTRNSERTNVCEEMRNAPTVQQWLKGQSLKSAVTSREKGKC